MATGVEVLELELLVSKTMRAELRGFYEGLGIETTAADAPAFTIGPARLQFTTADRDCEPFYHFAVLIPGDRFTAAREWLATVAPLLPGTAGQTTFDFDFWDAHASYVLDPAGNIVEVIAHQGVAESGASGPFDPCELRGISEIGLVTPDMPAAVKALQHAGLPLWSGEAQARSLAFCGTKAHTVIVASPGRGWLPTSRPAEAHPVRVRMRDRHGLTREIRVTQDGDLLVN